MEIASSKGGRPYYRWVPGYYVRDPAKGGDNRLYPPCKRSEAIALARQMYPRCGIQYK